MEAIRLEQFLHLHKEIIMPLVEEDKRKECCQRSENLELQSSDKADLTILKCKICGCRHFELQIDPGKFGLKGVRLG